MNQFSAIRSPAVSVLMACYNGSRWLHQAINSILMQTFEDFECILVDDGSTDISWKIIQSYRDQDQRIVAISKENTGLASSLNVGISQARGRWIARLDADDLCEPTRLAEQMRFVHNRPELVLLGTGCLTIDEQGRDIRPYNYPTEHCSLVRNLECARAFFPHSSAFYRTDIVRQIGGYNMRMYRAQDFQLWLQLSRRGEIACLPNILVRLRQHACQVSLENNGKIQSFYRMVALVCHFSQDFGCKGPLDTGVNEWAGFLSWLEKRMEKAGVFERHKVWTEARTAYFATENSLFGALRCGSHLLRSGHISRLMWDKMFGSLLPKCLARAWMKKSLQNGDRPADPSCGE